MGDEIISIEGFYNEIRTFFLSEKLLTYFIIGKLTQEMTLDEASKELLTACKNAKTFKILVAR